MAENPKTPAAKPKRPAAMTPPASPEPQAPKSRFTLIFKVLAVIVALCILIGIGFAAGVYFKLIDVEKLAQDMNLSQYPVVARFFPKTNFEPVELQEDIDTAQTVPPVTPTQIQPPAANLPISQPVNPNIITKEDLDKQAKQRQQEESKRISKLARLYGGMKPDSAVAIMKELDDPTVIAIFGKMEEDQVSKILSLFDSSRAARITQDMLRGQPQMPRL